MFYFLKPQNVFIFGRYNYSMGKKIVIILQLVFLTLTISAQYFTTGDDPGSVRWRNIKTLHFQLIYPEVFEGQAQRMAGILEKVYYTGGNSLKCLPLKIPVLFHSYSTTSNGLVGWAPGRMEFFTNPHQRIYPQDWLEQLAIHEFRHAVQLNKVSQNLPRIFPLLLGQQAGALFTGIYLPFWFIEGDAVVTETALSDYGRGRNPSFLMEIKAQAVERGLYSLEKAYLGSYRNFVPDYYKLGYYFVGETRKKFGPEIWEKAVYNVGNKPLSINSFNSVIRKTTKYNQRQLYHFIFDSLRNNWLKADKEYDSGGMPISKSTANYASYNPSFFLSDSTLVVLKQTLREVDQFIVISKNGDEKKLIVPGNVLEESVSMTGQKLLWIEDVPDLRWQNGGKSLIHIFDVGTQENMVLKPDYRAQSPSLSPDQKFIAMVESDFANNYYISVYDLNSSKLKSRFRSPDNNYFFSPRWINNEKLVSIMLTSEGKVFVVVDPSTGDITRLTGTSLGDIKHPVLYGDIVYFISTYDGKNSLYRLNLTDQSVARVFEPRFGAENPTIYNNNIIISDYTSNGYRLLDISNSIKNKSLKDITAAQYELADTLTSQEISKVDFKHLDSVKYFSQPYQKLSTLLNFHSWSPVYIDTESLKIQPGISFLSQNILGTAQTILGYKWDLSENAGSFSGKVIYSGFYPAFSSELSTGRRSADYLTIIDHTNQNNQVIWSDTITSKLKWSETNLNLKVWIPLNLSRGKYSTYFQPELKYNLNSRNAESGQPDWFIAGVSNTISYRAYFHHYLKKSYQDLVPNRGLIFDLAYKHNVGSKIDAGNLASIQTLFYLPGISNNHGIELYNGYQIRKTGEDYYFSDAVRWSRGGVRSMQNKMYSFSFDYKFPLIMPDLSLGKILYIKRINVDFYTDLAIIKGDIYNHGSVTGTYTKNITSLGLELTAENNFLRFFVPVEVGLRAGYTQELRNFYINFLYSINLPSF